MWYKIEKIINIFVGIMLLTNLYLFSGVFGIPSDNIIILCLIISAIFFAVNFNKDKFINLTNNWNTVFYISVSILFCIVDIIVNHSTLMLNDFIRVIIYSFYFTWTFNFYKDFVNLKKWFLIICFTTFIILVLEGLFESSNPIIFSLLFSGSNQQKILLTRIGGSIVDPNAYSGLFSFILLIIYFEWYDKIHNYKKIIFIVMNLLTIYLIEKSGSRQGLIIYLVFLIFLIFKNINTKKIIVLTLLTITSVLIIFTFWSQISQYVESNPSSSLARFAVGNNTSNSNASNIERKNSISTGIDLCIDNYFIYGPGLLNFSSRWTNFTSNPVPHNGLIFILTQFGILGFIPLFVIYKIALRSIKTGIFIFFITFFIYYSFLPNTMFYCAVFFASFYIDTKYLLEKTK